VRQTEALAHEEGVPERKPQKARSSGGGKSRIRTRSRWKSASATALVSP